MIKGPPNCILSAEKENNLYITCPKYCTRMPTLPQLSCKLSWYTKKLYITCPDFDTIIYLQGQNTVHACQHFHNCHASFLGTQLQRYANTVMNIQPVTQYMIVSISPCAPSTFWNCSPIFSNSTLSLLSTEEMSRFQKSLSLSGVSKLGLRDLDLY